MRENLNFHGIMVKDWHNSLIKWRTGKKIIYSGKYKVFAKI